MASAMLYLALSACATTAVGVFAAPDDGWDSWFEWDGDDGSCSGGARSGVFVGGAVGVGSEVRGACRQATRCSHETSEEESRARCER